MKNIVVPFVCVQLCLFTHISSAQNFYITDTEPKPGATDLPDTTTIRVTLNANVDSNSVTPSTFVVTNQDSIPYDGTFSIADSIIRFDPDPDFQLGDTVHVHLTDEIMSENALQLSDSSWYFSIKLPFQVMDIQPDSLAAHVALNVPILITCNDTIVDSTVTAESFVVTDKAGNPVVGENTVYTTEILFRPDPILAYDDSITVTLTSGILDDDNTPLTPFTSWFRTRSPFHVLDVFPAPGQTNVDPATPSFLRCPH